MQASEYRERSQNEETKLINSRMSEITNRLHSHTNRAQEQIFSRRRTLQASNSKVFETLAQTQ